MVNNLIEESFKFHGNNWLKQWDKIPPLTAKIIKWYSRNYPKLKLKLRIFNHYINDLSLYKHHNAIIVTNQNPIFKNKQKIEINILPNEYNEYGLYYVIQNSDKVFSLHNIYHIYLTHTHIVLHSVPDARTIFQAYQNNQIMADIHLNNLCPNKELRKSILEESIKIVRSHQNA